MKTTSSQCKESKSKPVSFVGSEDSLSTYFNEIKKSKSLTLAEEQALAARIQKGDKRAVNQLVEANLKFVVAVCRNYRNHGLPMVDLISEANLGLIRAAYKFDATQNFKFISYAVWWVRQAILTALAEQSRSIRISAGRATVMHRIGKVSRKLEQTLGRQPGLGEVAEEMGKSEQEITEYVQLGASSLSLTSPAPGDPDSNLMDCIKDENARETDAGARQFLLSGNMENALSSLDEQEGRVLRMYYGIGGKTTYTLEEIASHYEVTRERIRQIKMKALQKLRHPSRIFRIAAFQR